MALLFSLIGLVFIVIGACVDRAFRELPYLKEKGIRIVGEITDIREIANVYDFGGSPYRVYCTAIRPDGTEDTFVRKYVSPRKMKHLQPDMPVDIYISADDPQAYYVDL